MKPILTLATSTGIALLAATGVALAGTGNETMLSQNGDANTATITQSGDGNKAYTLSLIVPGSGVLLPAANMLQTGDSNRLELTQSGDNNEVGVKGGNATAGGTYGVTQQNHSATVAGNFNELFITQSSNGNGIQGIRQRAFVGAGGNTMTLIQKGGDGNVIGDIKQWHYGSSGANAQGQLIAITQDGSGNRINAVYQDLTGSGNLGNTLKIDIVGNGNNGAQPVGSYARTGYNGGGQFRQTGYGHFADIDIEGDSNGYGLNQAGARNTIGTLAITGNGNAFGIGQYGDDNTLTFVSGLLGNANDIGIKQGDSVDYGTSNQVTVDLFVGDYNRLLIEQAGTANKTSLSLDGLRNDLVFRQSSNSQGNSLDARVSGDDNELIINQTVGASPNATSVATLDVDGNGNYLNLRQNAIRGGVGSQSADITIDGDNNNNATGLCSTSFTGTAAALATANGLTPGDIVQERNNSAVTLNVTGSNNLFATTQSGNPGSTINGTVDGDGNQAVVAQIGNSNTATFTQTGNTNIISISQ